MVRNDIKKTIYDFLFEICTLLSAIYIEMQIERSFSDINTRKTVFIVSAIFVYNSTFYA